ncbi:MAG: glycogen synthase kinase mutation revertant [Lasallia pustulata]|uniref:Glycogen synthase kinase mutation revertant n=1 Tax=Lasallia pustulata TaxID=136370 RepID=A0A5M8PVI2_9LECA|nr:MAG: glycogen synthase kinase mutation revertant [Lasallia pustulata]
MQDSSTGSIEGWVDDVEFRYDKTEIVNSRSTALRIRYLAPQREIYSRDVIAVVKGVETGLRDCAGYRIMCIETKGEGYGLKQVRVTDPPRGWLDDFLIPAIPAHLSIPKGEGGLPNIHVIVSTKSGLCKAKIFCDEIVRPVFSACGLKHDEDYMVHETESVHSVTEFARTLLLPRANKGQRQTVLLLSGDGAVVDIVNVLLSSSHSDAYVNPVIGLVVMGTGNALAHSTGLTNDDTMGFASFLRKTPHSLPTFTARFSAGSVFVVDEGRGTEPIPQPEGSEAGVVSGAVVCSWALHAALVADSDTSEFRKHGSDRFLMAAKGLLSPSDGSQPHRFTGKITLLKKDENGKEVRTPLDRQEHMYILATLVSNLEQTLTISPSARPLDGQLRLVHFAPVSGDEVLRIMDLAYHGGAHIKEDVVGYEDIDGLRIDFDEPDEHWRRVCVDGKIIRVGEAGWMEVRREERDVLDIVANLGL